MAEAVLNDRLAQLSMMYQNGTFLTDEEYGECRSLAMKGYGEDVKKTSNTAETGPSVGEALGELSEGCKRELCDAVTQGIGKDGMWRSKIEQLADKVLTKRADAGCLADPKVVAAEIYSIIEKEIPEEAKASLSLTLSGIIGEGAKSRARPRNKRRRSAEPDGDRPSSPTAAELKSELAVIKQQNQDLQQQLYMYSQWAATATATATDAATAAAKQPLPDIPDETPPPPPPKKSKS
eukprot:TRINITY_DN10214_c0_g1_i2.p1 TRINITY_DN10214_c0_g1~~TRINITY_DN10214_c0_g1_i2.p1  ORF type:complete len:236 (+),score=69.94 TRINITY_DN10214_c0_g1_i2:809-1516(+)